MVGENEIGLGRVVVVREGEGGGDGGGSVVGKVKVIVVAEEVVV